MVLEHSPIAFPQPHTKPKIDLSPTHFNHILELYLSIMDSKKVSPLTISTYRQRIGRFPRHDHGIQSQSGPGEQYQNVK